MVIQDIIEAIDLYPFFYDNIRDNAVKFLSNKDRYINVIIGVRGRNTFVSPCIDHLKKAIENKPIVITIIEQDCKSNYKDLCNALGVDYIFIENSLIPNGIRYNRSFCFNAGFLYTKSSPWYIFQDIDILVDVNFFKNLECYITQGTKWVQPYTKKRVLLLNKEATDKICSDSANVSNLILNQDYKEASSGSTGGSIAVQRETFISTGGFDPELFYGYGPEDSFFWSKLEVSEKEVEYMNYHFAGGGVFADDPPIEIFHMYHESMQDSNPHLNVMHTIREAFWHSLYTDKLRVLDKKKEILLKYL